MEDDLWQKMTFDARWPLTEDDLWWKTTFDGRQPLTEDDLWRKTTFDGRRPLMKDDLWRRMTFDGRQPLMEDDWSHTSSATPVRVPYLLSILVYINCYHCLPWSICAVLTTHLAWLAKDCLIAAMSAGLPDIPASPDLGIVGEVLQTLVNSASSSTDAH